MPQLYHTCKEIDDQSENDDRNAEATYPEARQTTDRRVREPKNKNEQDCSTKLIEEFNVIGKGVLEGLPASQVHEYDELQKAHQ